MTRHFLADPVDDSLLLRILETARRVPSAGNTQGFDFVVLSGAHETARYWDLTLTPERREGFRWQSLLACPVLVTVWADPQAYVERYGEADKARSGLGASTQAWSTPYWTVDAAFASLALQYAAIEEGLGVLFFGMFEHSSDVAAALRVPSNHQPIGTVAVGWPDLEAETASGPAASRNRPRRPLNRRQSDGRRSHGRPLGESAVTDETTAQLASHRPLVHWGYWLGN